MRVMGTGAGEDGDAEFPYLMIYECACSLIVFPFYEHRIMKMTEMTIMQYFL